MRNLMLNVKCLVFNSKFKIQNSKLLRSGFSMVELIFVIVLLGILASIGGNILPDNRLLKYTNEVTMQIKDTQKNAIGKDVNGFGTPWSVDNNSTCITLDSSLHVEVSSRICFDEYGRPYDSTTEQLLLFKKDINITYNGTFTTISVLPMSGYVTLND